ncbi:MAG: hypothetical protein ACFFD1_13435 [Candidatus Thorarchaeota archaeon]
MSEMELKEYFFVFLRRNNEYKTPSKQRDEEIYSSHFSFINQQIEAKNMLVAGPLDGAGGLYFFDSQGKTKEDIYNLVKNDEAVKSGIFIPEVHKWFVPNHTIIFTFEEYNKIKRTPTSK